MTVAAKSVLGQEQLRQALSCATAVEASYVLYLAVDSTSVLCYSCWGKLCVVLQSIFSTHMVPTLGPRVHVPGLPL